MIERTEWQELPAPLRTAVERRAGGVVAAESVGEGLNCAAALVLATAEGRLFLKGVPETDRPGVAALEYEERVNGAVTAVAPRIRHVLRAGGWRGLLFDHVDGGHADLSPGSRDTEAVAGALARISGLRAPGLRVPPLAERFGALPAAGEAEALAGPYLLHTDTNPANLLVDGDGRAHVVDWAMPVLGPAWVDLAYTAVRLMECGHPPEAALGWLERFPAWRAAEPKAVEVFVAVTCRHWTAAIGTREAEPSNARFRRLLDGR
ncbi:phosphotransferase [Streptomyces sp. LP05-1]|uniref:Phosphotransferase n=1 Tax=Streptomyces pyxinae TaxID=2970734 RepID=A0ABT2CGZ0_9ACTN|nr:phosphotransferase [Streptomyces sp. LP05-1]MCS0635986.1 phosphotransferase [Streptomyces sp. LP05-1]